MMRYLKQTAVIAVALTLFACKKDEKGNQISDNTVVDDLIDKGWPRIVERDGAKLVYYQPQIADWKDFSTLTGDIAFSISKDNKEAVGIASVQASTLVDKDKRQVYLKDLKINDLRFPTLVADSIEVYSALVKELFPTSGNPVSVDRLLAEIQKHKQTAMPVDVKNDPPVIFFSDTPAILLLVPGDPVMAPIENTQLQYVVNTNWDLFYDKAGKNYYMLLGDVWLKAANLYDPWNKTTSLPADMKKLPQGEGFDEVIKAVPPPQASHAVPKVFYSSKPAELILTEGAPDYVSIPGTGLSYVNNTENDIFKDDETNTNYLLLSGRWFASRGMKGPWAYAGNSLPAGFSNIPENSPVAHVLTSVPGTQQAADAVMLAQIPTTAVVNKAEVEKKVKVHYDGDPQFKPIDKTNMQYAVNTQEKIIKVGDLYYLCFQGVWFMSAKADGPWKTATSVPSEIYTIPPSSPVYNVTYVTQVETSPTTVQSQTTGGYFGMFMMGVTVGVVLTYGSGWYYPPYIYYPPYMRYPIYRPWPMTYGVGAVYNPYTGGFAVGRRVYGPYGSVGSSAWYNPATGRYGRSASVQGWYGGRTVASAYNPWTGAYGATRQGHNPYAQWGNSVASRGNDWVRTGHISTRNGSAFGYQTSGGKQGSVVRGPNGGTIARTGNGVYAGRDGNVYRKDEHGGWSKYNKGDWDKVNNKPGVGHHSQSTGIRDKAGNTSAVTRKGQPVAKQNLGGETRQIPQHTKSQNLGGETRQLPDRTAGQNPAIGTRKEQSNINPNLGTATRQMPNRALASQSDVMQDLHSSDMARQRGEQQTQRFNNMNQDRGSNGGGQGFGGGARSGGGRFGRH